MKFIVFAFLLAVLAAAVAYSESEPTLPETALSEDDVDSTTVLSTSNEDSDEEEEEEDSDEEKTTAQPAVTSYDAPVVGYVRTYEEPVEPVEPQYVITYSVPAVPTVPAPTPAPLYGAPVSSYDPPVVLPYWLRPRT